MTLRGKGKRNETLELHTAPIQSHAEDTSANHSPSREEIRLRAYEIYLERGGLPGNELDDWLLPLLQLVRRLTLSNRGLLAAKDPRPRTRRRNPMALSGQMERASSFPYQCKWKLALSR